MNPELGTDNGTTERHPVQTTNNQHPTLDNQESTTPPTVAPDNLQSPPDNRHPATNNKQLPSTDKTENQLQHPTTDMG